MNSAVSRSKRSGPADTFRGFPQQEVRPSKYVQRFPTARGPIAVVKMEFLDFLYPFPVGPETQVANVSGPHMGSTWAEMGPIWPTHMGARWE